MTGVLETARLILRAPDRREAADIMVLADNPRVASMLAQMPSPYGLRDALGWIDACQATARATDRRGLGIYVKAARPFFIGGCGFGPFGKEALPQFGYWIGEPHWGKGYASEAARAVLQLAFAGLGMELLQAGSQVANPASRAILRNLGFRHLGTGTIYAPARKRDEQIDKFVLRAHEWRAARGE